ncbi:MAG: translation initiation factor [Lentisphaerales bacterium]|nr:translation initiation factor [Lentisphaerales bacterium]
MGKKKQRYQSEEAPSNNPFGGLDLSFSNEQLSAYEEEKEAVANEPESFAGGLVRVRLEKKGRGGKSVTVFYEFDKEQDSSLPELLKGLKKHLAAGGKVVEDSLELQGDQRLKAAEWLEQQGYKVKGQLI